MHPKHFIPDYDKYTGFHAKVEAHKQAMKSRQIHKTQFSHLTTAGGILKGIIVGAAIWFAALAVFTVVMAVL